MSQATNLISMNGAGPNLIEKILFQTILFVDWEDLLKPDELNADSSARMYLDKINMLLDKINMLLDTYAPLIVRVSKYKMKFKSKPWITVGLQKLYL